MIVFVYGTTAEAIKLAPIMRRLDESGVVYQQWLTYQHTDALRAMLPKVGVPEPEQEIANGNSGRPLKGYGDVLAWLWSIARWMSKNRRRLRRELPTDTVFVVHGDTMTSVVGAFVARVLGRPSAHVEAGLRSGNWRHPFPEELDRRIVGRLAQIHYAPSNEAVRNLRGRRNVVFTHGNTVNDAVLDHGQDAHAASRPVGIVLLHRFELISDQRLVDEAIQVLADESRVQMVALVDAYSGSAITDAVHRLGRGRIEVRSKLDHEEFVQVLGTAAFVITDSGGIQEETALLGVPTLIHRVATERREGLGENAMLSEWKLERVGEFLRDFERFRRSPAQPEVSPSDVVVADLVARGFG